MEEELADFIKDLLGSKETVQAILQGSEYAMIRVNTNLWSHFWGSIRRKREGIPNAGWKAMGGIMCNLHTKELTPQMEQVPDELYQRAFHITKSLAIPGRLPQFDQKVFGTDQTYRIIAATEWSSHIPAFYTKAPILDFLSIIRVIQDTRQQMNKWRLPRTPLWKWTTLTR